LLTNLVWCGTFSLKPQASSFKLQAYGLQLVACGLWLVACGLQLMASGTNSAAAKVQLLLLIGFLGKYTRSD
jgi:hypothetical protein